MCDFKGMRYYSYWYESPLRITYVFEVGEDGLPTNLESEVQLGYPLWEPLRLYVCECGCELSSWEDAKDHLELYNQERTNASA